MIAEKYLDVLGSRLLQALEHRGFAELTPVQEAVLDPSLLDCDLRIMSQTGSGKTVAIGLALRQTIDAFSISETKTNPPCAMVVVPTRELAKQVHGELSWLFAAHKIRLACVTGGSSYRDEHRALSLNPAIVVGTPGRLVDHLHRKAFDATSVSTIVLDEADRMLDLGFAEALETIFLAAPSRKRTHLVSATLAPEVMRLANRFQANPREVHGTHPGEAHADIEHLVHLVPPRHRLDALVNVLLAEPDERTLVFVRTRVDVTTTAHDLAEVGFRVATLSGDMEQPARERSLLSFRQGKVRVLVATDVAARGIDIQGMTRVIHLDPPTDPDSYTHRSGRTGRAGQKGSSIVFVAPERQRQLQALLNQARVKARVLPLPDAESLRVAADARTMQSLTDSLVKCAIDPRQRRLAEEVLRDNDATSVVAMLIARTKSTLPEPRQIPAIVLPALTTARDRRAQKRAPLQRGNGSPAWDDMAHRQTAAARRAEAPMLTRPGRATRGSDSSLRQRIPSPGASQQARSDGWGMFHVTWGQLQGADPRRMLAVICRRGNIRGADVGAIRIGPTSTIVEVRSQVAAEFASQARKPDPEEPRIRITEVSPTSRCRLFDEPRSARGHA
jgi:ATP-dependent RNA helicase DeaD